MVMMNSAFESILPSLASGVIANRAMKNRKEITCSALNNIKLNGSNGSSRGYRPKSSFMEAFQRRNDPRFRQGDGLRKYPRCRRVEHVVLTLEQDRTDKSGKRRIHRDRHAIAHQAHGGFHDRAVCRVDARDWSQHDDEADDGAEQTELHQSIARTGAKVVRSAQPVSERPQQQGLIETSVSLRLSLDNKVADMIGDESSRQRVLARRNRRDR